MGKVRRRFDEQYKREAVRFLEETGRPLREVAAELKVAEGSLWRWRKRYGTGAGGPQPERGGGAAAVTARE